MNTNPAGYTYSDYLAHQDDELYHFGIKGMKWGIRRFQKKDGSLTPAGRKHIKTNPSYDSDKEARKAKIKKAAKIAAGVAATAAVAYGGYRLYKSGKGKQLVNALKSRTDGPKPVLNLPQKKKMELSVPGNPIGAKRSRKIVGKRNTYNSRKIKGGKLKNQTAGELYDRVAQKYQAKEDAIRRTLRKNKGVVDGPFGDFLPKESKDKAIKLDKKLNRAAYNASNLRKFADKKASGYTKPAHTNNDYLDYSHLAKKYERLGKAAEENMKYVSGLFNDEKKRKRSNYNSAGHNTINIHRMREY